MEDVYEDGIEVSAGMIRKDRASWTAIVTGLTDPEREKNSETILKKMDTMETDWMIKRGDRCRRNPLAAE